MLKSALAAAPAAIGCRWATAWETSAQEGRPSRPSAGLIGPERAARFAYVDQLIRSGSSVGEPKQVLYKSAGEQSRMLRAKRISCRELTDLHIAWIERINPTINALADRVPPAELRKQADAVDEAVRRGTVDWRAKPLTGLLVWLKMAPTRGLRATMNTLGLKDVEPGKEDTIAPMLLREAGAMIAGFTNYPEFGFGYETDNLVVGRTNNPRALDRIPGGSSGGIAAALVAGFGPLALGGDGGGSSRHPAANSGCVGLKETWRRCPGTGIGRGPSSFNYLVVHGPLCRYVRDVAMMETVLAEADGIDPFVPPMPMPDYTRIKIPGLRIAVMPYNGMAKAEPAILSALDRTAASLEKAGAVVKQAKPAMIEQTYELYNAMESRNSRIHWRRVLEKSGTGARISPLMAKMLKFHNGYEEEHRCSEPSRVIEIDENVGAFQESIAGFFERFDALLCPVQTEVAMKHGTTCDNMPAFTYMQVANLTGMPALAVPAEYLQNGLSVGLQIIAPKWREDIALAIGEHIEAQSGGWKPSTLPLFRS